MKNAPYFDEDPLMEGEADRAVQEMARRQFGVSLFVAFVLLAVAGLTVMKTTHIAPLEPIETAAHHRMAPAQEPPTDFAQPAQQTMTKG